jgi:threonine/homoserine/homoserine lactone efflux protein
MLWRTTVGLGALLVVLGLAGYAHNWSTSDHPSLTALIPAGFGVGLAVLGALASQERWRKHAMHLAAVIALVGFVAAAGRLLLGILRGSIANLVAAASQGIMAVICAYLLWLCVQSFREARRRRAAGTASQPPQSSN